MTDGGRDDTLIGDEVFFPDISSAILSCKAFPLTSRSDKVWSPSNRVVSLLADLNGLSFSEKGREVEAGEAGGGIVMALGILARGVINEGRPLDGVVEGMPTPILELRPPGFGVLYGEGNKRVGDPKLREARVGDGIDRLGLGDPWDGAESRELSCLAVIFKYLDAREPSVILCSKLLDFRLLDIVGVFTVELEEILVREDAGVCVVLGVTRP